MNRWLDRALGALRFGRKARWLLGGLAIAVFVIMTGAAASLVRAAVMSLLATIALSCGRRSAPGRVVVYAAGLMLLVSPSLLRTDVGFLLSIAATLGLIFIAPIIEPIAAFLPKRFGIAKTFAETVAATLATLPVSLTAFGQVSLVALFANLLLLPFVPATMGIGLVAALVAGFFPVFAGLGSIASAIFVGYDLALIRLLARVPGASVSNVMFGPLAAAFMAAAILYVVTKHHAHPQQEGNR